jgi:Trypsin-co-occurring domain 1
MDEQYELVDVQLPGGGTVSVRAVSLGGGADVSALDQLSLKNVADSIQEIAVTIGSALKKAAAKKASVNFGIEVAVQSGKLTSLLVQGSGTATLNVTLEWGS